MNYANRLPVIVYTKNNCKQCDLTKAFLKRHGIPYREVNVEQDPDTLDKVKAMGYQQVPVVVVPFEYPTSGGHHWSGLQPDNLKRLLG